MHPALLKLISLQARATIRRMLRGGKSPIRIIGFVLGAGICIGWLIVAGSAALRNRNARFYDRVEAVMPLALLAMCVVTAVTSAGDKAIAFTPGEVDQLFPGPFTRRQLLGYKLLKSTLLAMLSALILSIPMLKYARWWPACLAAVFLTLLLVQWLTICLLLAGQAVGEAAHSRARKLIIGGAIVVVILGARTWMAAGAGGGETAVYAFRNSTLGHALLAPFQPFADLMVSPGAGGLVRHGLLAAAIDVALLMTVLLLDAHYIETAISASERRYAKIRRMRSGSFLSMNASKSASWRLPLLPWLGGAGPIAWRQLTTAARSSRGILLLMFIVAVGAAPTLGGHGVDSIHLLGIVLGWLTFLCSSMLMFDFRGDVDQMESLKALPAHAWAVAAGQLVAPVALLSLMHALMLGIAAFALPAYRAELVLGIVLAVPFNALLFGAENLIFLLFPSRPAAVSPGDFQVMGRKFMFMILKMMILMIGGLLALIPAAMAWQLTGGSRTAGVLAASVALAAETVAMLPLLAWAYRRYDPSLHTPA